MLDNTKKPALQLCAAHELSDFSRFTRNEYGNFMTMISKTVAERTTAGQRQSVEEQGALRLAWRVCVSLGCGLALTRG